MSKTLLVINAGSSSLKFAVFSGPQEKIRGTVEQIGGRARLFVQRGRSVKVTKVQAKTLTTAFRLLQQTLIQAKLQPTAVAHRIVHGGDIFFRPTKITPATTKRLRQFVPLAPLHMPANLAAVRLARRAWPTVNQWAVFDTAPFHNLPEYARLYAIPVSVAKRFHIRKYGFHGISHRWAMAQAARRLGKLPSKLNMVTIHLGAGDSMALWQKGKAIDTTMGFTPLEGLTMSTRSGDLDPMIPLWLQQHGYTLRQVIELLEKNSGLYGLTGLRDMRDILAATGHPIANWPRRRWTLQRRKQCRLAINMFTYDVQRYLSSYCGLLPTINAIVFTGAIGQNHYLQEKILNSLTVTKYRRLTVPTDEERAIAEMVAKLIH